MSEGSDRRFFYGYVVAASGFFLWFIIWGTYITFGVFFMPVLKEFGWSRAETVLAYSIGVMVHNSLAIATGWLTDRVGPKFVVTVFGSFLGISYLLMSQINSLDQFQLYFGIVAAIGLSVGNTPIMATVARWFVKRRGLMLGIVQAGVSIGGFVFSPLAAWLILNYGWRSSYIILGIVTLSGIIICGLFLERDPSDLGQNPDGVYGLPDTDEISRESSSDGRRMSLWEVVQKGQFWIIAGLYFGFGFCRSTFLAHIAAHVQDLGFSLTDGANVMGALLMASIFGRIGMGRVADAIGNKRAFMMSYIATAISLVWALMTTDLWGCYLFAFIFGFGWGAQAVLRFAVTSEAFGLVSIGFLMGVLGIAEAGAAAFGAYYAGYIFDMVGNYRPVFWVGLGVSLLGMMLNTFLKREH